MKAQLCFGFLILSCQLFGQNTFCIDYQQKIYYKVSKKGKKKTDGAVNTRLIYNDSASLYYHTDGKNEVYNNLTFIGDKLIHHALRYQKNTDELLSDVAWPTNRYLIIVDSLETINWVYTSYTKSILGYDCNLAYSVDEKSDTTFAFYTSQIGSVFGPDKIIGLPGVSLEVAQQKYNLYIEAKRVVKSAITLLPIVNVKRVNPAEFRKIRENN